MKVYSVNDVGRVGLVSQSDKSSLGIDPAAMNMMEDARTRNGSIEPFGGWQQLDTAPATGGGACSDLNFLNTVNGIFHFSFYDLGIFSTDSANHYDVTRDTGIYYGGLPANAWPQGEPWDTGKKGNRLWANNAFDALQVHGDPVVPGTQLPDTRFQDVVFSVGYPTAADIPVTCVAVTAFKSFMVIANIVENGEHFPNEVWWSDAVDPGFFPNGEGWNYASPLTLSGKLEVGRGTGAILRLEVMRNSIMVYTERGTHRLELTGDDRVFTEGEVFGDVGVYNRRGCVEADGLHYVVTDNDIIKHDGQQKESICDERIRTLFFNDTNQFSRHQLTVTRRVVEHEIWFINGTYIPSPDLQPDRIWPSKAYVYNLDDDTWSIYLLQTINEVDKHNGLSVGNMREMPLFDQSGSPELDFTYDSELADTLTYETTGDLTYNSVIIPAGNVSFVGFDNTLLFQIDVGLLKGKKFNIGDVPQPVKATVARLDINISGDETVQVVTAVYPRVKSAGTVIMAVGTHDAPDDPVRWREQIEFDPNTTYQIPVKARGRRHAIGFYNNEAGFSLQGYDLAYEDSGFK